MNRLNKTRRPKHRCGFQFSSALLFLAFLLPQEGQTAELAKDPETVATRIAQHILRSTTWDFHDRKSGEIFTHVSDERIDTDFRVRSVYNQWHYGNAVMLMGMLSLSETTGDPAYRAYATRYFDFTFDHIPFFRKHYGPGRPWVEYQSYFRTRSLDDCGMMAAAAFETAKIQSRPEFAAYWDTVSEFILNYPRRLEGGAFYHGNPRKRTVWADHVYMSAPFLARMGAMHQDDRFFDEALLQLAEYHRLLWNESRGLYHHGYYADEDTRSFAHWGRANGWIAMAKVEILKYLPEDHPKRPWVIRLLREQIEGFSNYQSESGLWHQLLDRPDSFPETSCTAMFVYATAYAVNRELIHPNYLKIATNGWNGLATMVTPEGALLNCCEGTGVRDDVAYYLTRQKPLMDRHGSGATLLAATELIQAKRNPR